MNELRIEEIHGNESYIHEIKKLYNRNFPMDERIPFGRLIRMLSDTKIMYAWFDDNTLIGLSVVFLYKDLVYLAYLVTEEKYRDHGYGSKILKELETMFQGHRIVLDMEQLDDKADNAEERRSRRDFYIRNGFKGTGYWYCFFHVNYELLSYGGIVTGKEYHDLIVEHWGKIAEKAVFQDHPFTTL